MSESLEKVIEGKLAAAEMNNIVVTVITKDDVTTLTINNVDAERVAEAKEIIGRPFSFDIRIKKKTPVNDDAFDPANWDPTGITGADIQLVNAVQESTTGEAGVEIVLRESGRTKMATLFKNSPGQDIGVFVRDRLISSLSVNGEIKERIVIRGIPSLDIAKIFADDVNVGLHVTLTPAS